MRFILWSIFSVMIFSTAGANLAHAQNTNVYNGKYYNNASNGNTMYNSGKGSANAGPLSIKNMIRGAKQNTSNKYKSGITPYHMGAASKKSYSQTSTPSEIKARRAKDRAERDYLKKKKYDYDTQERARRMAEESSYQEATSKYKSQFKTNDKDSGASRLSLDDDRTVAVKKKSKPVFNTKGSSYGMPKKVFNSYN